MYIPHARVESPPVPAVLNKIRQRRRSSEDLNSTRDSAARESTCVEDGDNDLNDESASLNVSRISGTSRPEHALSTSHGSLAGLQDDDNLAAASGSLLDTTLETDSKTGRGSSSLNDQKRILSQLSALRQVNGIDPTVACEVG